MDSSAGFLPASIAVIGAGSASANSLGAATSASVSAATTTTSATSSVGHDEDDDFLFLDLAPHDHDTSTGSTSNAAVLNLPSFMDQMSLERKQHPVEAAAAVVKEEQPKPSVTTTAAATSLAAATIESLTTTNNNNNNNEEEEEDNKLQQQEQLIAISTTSTTTRARKSSLKTNSSYGNLEEIGENIPVCTKKSSWKKLPVPHLDHQQYRNNNIDINNCRRQGQHQQQGSTSLAGRRRESSPSLLQTAAAQSSSPLLPLPLPRNVSFSKIQVRDYEIMAGDHPGGMFGVPVSLGWMYSEHAALEVEDYEAVRPARRSRGELHMNALTRQQLLQQHDVSRSEMEAAEKEAEKVRSQREHTKAMIPLAKLEDLVESATRKAKRFGMILGGGSSHSKHQLRSKRIPRSSSAGCLSHHNPTAV